MVLCLAGVNKMRKIFKIGVGIGIAIASLFAIYFGIILIDLTFGEYVGSSKYDEMPLTYPTNFDECVAAGGHAAEAPRYISQKGLRCALSVSSLENREAFDTCRSQGGGMWIVEAGLDGDSPSYEICSIYYYESGGKCLGSFCD